MIVRDALQDATKRLTARNLRSPRFDAELILMSVLECDRTEILANPSRSLTSIEKRRFEDWVKKREGHYPIQYLRGRQEFYGRDFIVNPAVLIPRPETELLVEITLEWLGKLGRPDPQVIEVGTGSGCLGVTLLCEHPGLYLTAIDISRAALEVARLNAEKHSCVDRIILECSDGLIGAASIGIDYDLIVSNPPYGSARDRESVDPGVRLFEPPEAVFAGETGLEMYRKIFAASEGLLKPDGGMLLELGYGQRRDVEEMAQAHGWEMIDVRRDLAGIERCAVLRPTDAGRTRLK